jgi:tetratricopeptide (TPR) repeat protein
MKHFCLIFLILSLITLTSAEEVQILFDRANELYRTGDYKNAAAIYNNIIKNGYNNSSLYYNLANSYFKSDNLAGAIVNYERAKKISPNDEDINYNLRIVNLKVVDKIEPVPTLFFFEWWNSISKIFTSDSWAVLMIIALWNGLILVSLYRIAKTSLLRRIFFFGALFLICSALVAGVYTLKQNQIERNENMAIIYSPSVTVKSSPDENGTDLFILHEGVKVEVLDKIEKWEKIKLADGKIGWLLSDTVEII